MATDSFKTLEIMLEQRVKSFLVFQFAQRQNAYGQETHWQSPYITTLWQSIHEHYTQPHRHYHTLIHLAQMFAHFDDYTTALNHPDAVTLAIWYHDIIYDPTTADNECQSADYFIHAYADSLPSAFIQHVASLIMMTARHQLDKTASESILEDAEYFLDMDLAILGREWSVYEQYAKQVRLEYQYVPLVDYQRGRIAVLQSFLNKERLYLTKDFVKRFEVQARENIKREIVQLSSKF